MKQVIKCVLFLVVVALIIFGYFTFKEMQVENKKNELKDEWYVEIIYDTPINVRKDHYQDEESIGKVKKGEVYKVLDMDTETDSIYYWYKIDFNGKEGWIASGRRNFWVKDYNNPNDIMVPQIKFESNLYQVRSIDDINYKHLTIIEDKPDPVITHVVYHEVVPEENKNQYWILYTITDQAGKSSSKMQKIEFEITPDESRVLDFADYMAD